jgi:hypothetical protein
MFIEVQDKLVATQVFEQKFVCDLNACKGACCIQGDAGAPLNYDEIEILEENLEEIIPYMRLEGISAVTDTGVFYMDTENEPVSTLVNGEECVFVFFDEKGSTKCAIEQAYNEGKITFKKPISCHLYPIRVKKFNDKQALTFEQWDICAPACSCGEALNVPVYQFLKEPITRAFGTSFFTEMALVGKHWKQEPGK